MNRGKMVRVTFNVPTRFNTGAKIPLALVDEFLDEICQRFGGYSILPKIQGAWWSKKENKVLFDLNRLIWVVIPASRIKELRSRVKSLGRQLKQEAMYFEVVPIEAEFIDCSEE